MVFNRFRDKASQPLSADDFLFRTPAAEEERQTALEQNKKRNMIDALTALATASRGRPPRRRKAPRR
jgi:hypothetical protein